MVSSETRKEAACDALLAGRAEDVRLTIYPDVEVGEEGWITLDAAFTRGRPGTVDCALAADPRLLPGGRLRAVRAGRLIAPGSQ